MTTPVSAASPDSARERWQAWHDQREATLREPTGWLSLVSLTWIDETPREVPGFPGLWSAIGNTVTIDFTDAPGEPPITLDSAPAPALVNHEIVPGDTDRTLAAGDVEAEVARRGERMMVRIRDPRAATRTSFTGVPTYPFDESWLLTGTYEPYPEPVDRAVPSAQPGLTSHITIQGRIHFAFPDGTPATWEVGGDPDSLSVSFRDATNGVATSAWRSAPVRKMSIDEGDAAAVGGPGAGEQVIVDFTRSVNFPAHFTPFGTCPTPVEGNATKVAVEAGELTPTTHSA